MLIQLENLYLSFGNDPIFNQAQFYLKAKERVAIIGRNGAGKSTLFNILVKEIEPEEGTLRFQPDLRVHLLPQDVPPATEETVGEIVAKGLDYHHKITDRYYKLLEKEPNDETLHELALLQEQIEKLGAWDSQVHVNSILSRFQLNAETKMKELSGGWRRRVLLAQTMVSQPDVLLLDEPTNHLDLIMIDWLERELLYLDCSVIFITHDRQFMRNLATRIVEIERGNLISTEKNYTSFLEWKEHQQQIEEEQNNKFDKKLAEEEKWIRQGVKARRTRNEGRVRALKKLREERKDRVLSQDKATFTLNEAQRSGKLVSEMKKVSFSYDSIPILSDFDYTLQRGNKIGLIGPNGTGKSTFLRLLLGELEPQSGQVKKGANVEVSYFDQLRDQLILDKTVLENISEGKDHIIVNGHNRHIFSYLNDFLFTHERMNTQVRYLSGGEKNRLLLAKLFSYPANVFVLDEPTNDLDQESLELLEELLAQFTGTVLLVSHDREFLDNVVEQSLIFTGEGSIQPFSGGYSDWISWGGGESFLKENRSQKNKATDREPKANISVKATSKKTKKLSYKLQNELDQLPVLIDQLENETKQKETQMLQPEFYEQSPEALQCFHNTLETMQASLNNLIERWSELEDLKSQ